MISANGRERLSSNGGGWIRGTHLSREIHESESRKGLDTTECWAKWYWIHRNMPTVEEPRTPPLQQHLHTARAGEDSEAQIRYTLMAAVDAIL